MSSLIFRLVLLSALMLAALQLRPLLVRPLTQAAANVHDITARLAAHR